MNSLAAAAVEQEVALGMMESGNTDFIAAKNPSQVLHEELDDWWAKDVVSGEALDPAMVKAARREGLAYFRSIEIKKKSRVHPVDPAIRHHFMHADLLREPYQLVLQQLVYVLASILHTAISPSEQ